MFLVISGTNRPGSNTLKIAKTVAGMLDEQGQAAKVLDLQTLPAELFLPESYATKPASFAPFQEAVDACSAIVTVVPEYNGSFPGVLKYFLDMVKFPESLVDVPSAFVGLSAGRWGGVRAVEQLETVFLYRHAQIYGRRVFMPGILQSLGGGDELVDDELRTRLHAMLTGFATFAGKAPRS